MAFDPAHSASLGGPWPTIAGFVDADGSARHSLVRRLAQPLLPARDVADVVLALCMLHGRQPGVLDHALARNSLPAVHGWMELAVAGFATERALLARLASAAGPLPSTPGQAESEAAIVAQRHALDMLAQSDRTGCAVGAAIALVVDWRAIRVVLDAAAVRLGFDAPPSTLPTEAETATIAAAAAGNPQAERAMAFGAQQVLAQHRGLWDLLEARVSARDRI